MEPKEKARELVERFEKIIISANADNWTNESKQCALIAVEEILKSCAYFDYKIKERFEDTAGIDDRCFSTYWQEVKSEIEKL